MWRSALAVATALRDCEARATLAGGWGPRGSAGGAQRLGEDARLGRPVSSALRSRRPGDRPYAYPLLPAGLARAAPGGALQPAERATM
eukprot:COSAG05_NODE_416_length_10031_cov_18.951067_1_plen_88_part_00